MSWNIRPLWLEKNIQVTLHVSVWVEIFCHGIVFNGIIVTLHVSVWVEIIKTAEASEWHTSRSTWACELKYFAYCTKVSWAGHAPRERVSWNHPRILHLRWAFSHAPRERVSWNEKCGIYSRIEDSHAPRERVSWNKITVENKVDTNEVTLHVSVWVEIAVPWLLPPPATVTLHVSVWVEM